MSDTTPEYIEKCRKAKEIQEAWEPTIGDWVIDMGDLWLIGDKGRLEYVKSVKENDTFLPLQDQLQGIIAYIASTPILMLRRFIYLTQKQVNDIYWQQFTSMEQLWLAFVMHEKYSKQWLIKSQEWVKCETIGDMFQDSHLLEGG